ncbi:competence protein ComEA [Pseudomonas delhiensis]|uniref:Competence protein ComEA n=1 Tax=Pseudomonas delhiensis TaxID=366289 RepID=A0A239MPW3_9PSED|nr:helix-hairpin-helix domain-containing protein [Pseudomonas delhiensis]SDI00315.1 competence protein ComEA [Pseudomonas delhiensis]SNT44283.1 competence protein ComEA [Pseudomonas delhiensis]
MLRLPAVLLILLTGLCANATAQAAADSEKLTPATVVMHQADGAKVNLNTADAASLQQALSGIGKSKAEAIVAYRESNGPFASVDQLLEVKGIGKALLDRNRDRLSVE